MSRQHNSIPISTHVSSNHITTGLALFSMFFGAGNLIFPLLIGKTLGNHVWFAILGLGLTAVVMPFFGLATMVLYDADHNAFFGRLGKLPGTCLLLLLQLILGPFGVIPRLITLMHAMAKPYLSDLSLAPFTLLMAIVIFVCSRKRQKLIPLLGLLTPILLFCIIALVYFGLMQGSSFQGTVPLPRDSFIQGLVGGYQTMDLIAAFIFATVIMPRFQTASGRVRLPAYGMSFAKQMIPPSIIAASLLFLTYIGLCLISSFHGSTLDSSCPSELLLSAIATKLLGPVGACIAAIAVIVACLTTAITLSVTFAEYVQSQTKINSSLALIGTLIISTLVANLGFEGIVTFLSPILQMIYPGLIVLTILNFLHSVYGVNFLKGPVFFSFACSALFYFFKK